MKSTLLAAAALAAFAMTGPGPLPGGTAPDGIEDHARIDPSKTLELIRRIKDAGGVVFAS